MVDYYRILRISRRASAAEIKSAYRRLARQQHPDLNGGSERASREFSLIALAYRTLSDPIERARYDAQRERLRPSTTSSISSHRSSVVHSSNPHAKRMRIVATQARWDRAVDRWIEAERRETYARTQAVFTTVTLFLSTFMVAMLKPRFWDSFDIVGRGVLLTLFLIGVWHLASRLRASFALYTYRRPRRIEHSITREEKSDKPFSRATASAFLVIGYITSLTAGLFAGDRVYYVVSDMAFFFGQQLRPDLLFYPPIAVLIINTMHTVASKIDS